MEHGQVFLKDSKGLLMSAGINVGDVLQFKASYDSRSRCLSLDAVNRSGEIQALSPFQMQCHIVFYRYEVNRLFALPARSQAFRKLMDRIGKLLTEPGPFLEQRFPGSVRKGQDRFPSTDSLFAGIDIGSMSDNEVQMMASLEDPEQFLAASGRGRAVNETVRALVSRVVSQPQLGEMVKLFRAESRLRADIDSANALMLSEQVETYAEHQPYKHSTDDALCDPRGGHRDVAYSPRKRAQQKLLPQGTFASQPKAQRNHVVRDGNWIFPSLVSQSLANMLESYFVRQTVTIGQLPSTGRGLVEVQSDPNQTWDVAHVVSNDNNFKKTFIIVGVAEDMLDVSGDMSGLTMRPAWLRRPPQWLDAKRMEDDAADEWHGFFACLQEEGFDDVRPTLARMIRDFDPTRPGSLHFAKKIALVHDMCATHPARDVECRHRSAQTSRFQNEPAGAQRDVRRDIDRHPSGRPKLILKPRTRPV
jgi:hypothetical protein